MPINSPAVAAAIWALSLTDEAQRHTMLADYRARGVRNGTVWPPQVDYSAADAWLIDQHRSAIADGLRFRADWRHRNPTMPQAHSVLVDMLTGHERPLPGVTLYDAEVMAASANRHRDNGYYAVAGTTAVGPYTAGVDAASEARRRFNNDEPSTVLTIEWPQ